MFPEGLLLFKDFVYVPDYENLKIQILQKAHSSPEVGHPGQAKTLEVVTRNFHWPRMREFINEYIKTCDQCQRNKAGHRRKYGLLNPLPIPIGPHLSLSMDHITDPPPSQGFDRILGVVDRLTKQSTFIKARATDTSKDLARQFLDHVFRYHGLPDDIVSDRGPTFTFGWWTAFCQMANIKPNLSTAFHPESDGQTERVHQSLQLHLRTFCDFLQDDWVDLLSIAELAYNSTHHSSIGMTPFYANHGYHPRMSLTILNAQPRSATQRIRQIQLAHELAKQSIAKANVQYVYWANKKRLPAPDFHVSDKVWLLRRHVKTSRPSQGLEANKLGPYPILARIGKSAFKLSLPASMQIHPVFHVSLLEKFHANTFRQRDQPPPPDPIIVDGQPEHFVERIIDAKIQIHTLMYLVRWAGQSDDTRQGITAHQLGDQAPQVTEFHDKHPNKPKRIPV